MQVAQVASTIWKEKGTDSPTKEPSPANPLILCFWPPELDLKNKVSGNLRAVLNNQEYPLHALSISKIGMEIKSF